MKVTLKDVHDFIDQMTIKLPKFRSYKTLEDLYLRGEISDEEYSAYVCKFTRLYATKGQPRLAAPISKLAPLSEQVEYGYLGYEAAVGRTYSRRAHKRFQEIGILAEVLIRPHYFSKKDEEKDKKKEGQPQFTLQGHGTIYRMEVDLTKVKRVPLKQMNPKIVLRYLKWLQYLEDKKNEKGEEIGKELGKEMKEMAELVTACDGGTFNICDFSKVRKEDYDLFCDEVDAYFEDRNPNDYRAYRLFIRKPKKKPDLIPIA